MTLSAEDEFISNFHSLSGSTIGERRKNLFNLLKKTQQSTCGEISFTSLQPKTLLEESFKVEALLFFKKIPDLIEVLKSENPILIEKILKADPWFIKNAFENISGEKLVTQIFPCLSFNIKLKLINKLSLHLNNVEKADEFFESIKEVYGVYLASKLLPSCSDSLIIKCLNFYRVEITPTQLLNIIKKYPSLTESIFEKLHQYESKVSIGLKYKLVFNNLMLHNVPIFLKLNEKYNPEFRLGLRTTRKFINTNKQIVVKEAKKLHRLLNTKQTTKYIRDDFEAYFLNVFPKSICRLEETYTDYLSLLNGLSSDVQKFTILSTTFKSIHGSELLDHSAFLTHETMKLMPSYEREIWLQTHTRPKEITEEVWISFMNTDKSLPLLKQRISLTANVTDREELIASLVRTCAINKNKEALADVCCYVLNKHRNDNVHVRRTFVATIAEYFDLLKLESEHWKCIIELIHLVNFDVEGGFVYNDVFEKYIHYCCMKDVPLEEHLKFWLKLRNHYNICQAKPEYEKKCLLMFKDLIPVIHKGKDFKTYYLCYLVALIEWNKRHRKDQLSLFLDSSAIDLVKERLNNEEYTYPADCIAIHCMKMDYKKSKDADLVRLLLSRNQEYYFQPMILNWLIKNHPDDLVNYVEPLIQNFVSMFIKLNSLSSFFRNYVHLELPQKISKICLDIINTDDSFSYKKKNAIFILAYTMESSDFINFASLYYPSDLAPDLESKEGQNRYKTQINISSCFKNIIPSYVTLESVLQFCKGDYLKLVQKSMYLIAQNVAEKRLAPFFDVLMQRAVSVRKHAIFLAFKVGDKAKAFNILLKFMKSEKNSSIHKSLFKSIFHYFLKNADDYSWELVKEILKVVDVNDTEASTKLTKCKNIPLQYFVRYAIFAWDFLESLPSNPQIEESKCCVLDGLIKVELLPKEFCMGIIEKYFFKTSEFNMLQKAVHGFTCRYIICCPIKTEQEERIRSVLNIVKTCIKSSNLINHKFANNFVNEFCAQIRTKETPNMEILVLFEKVWNNLLQPYEAYEEYLSLQFTLIFLNFTNEKQEKHFLTKVGENIALLCDRLYDEHILDIKIFSEYFDTFKCNFLSKEFEDEVDEKQKELILCEGILKTSNTPNCIILLLSLLPERARINLELQTRVNLIVDLVAKHSTPVVQMGLHHYLKYKEWD